MIVSTEETESNSFLCMRNKCPRPDQKVTFDLCRDSKDRHVAYNNTSWVFVCLDLHQSMSVEKKNEL